MEDMVLFFGSVLVMAVASRGLLMALHENIVIESLQTGLSKRALRVGRQYKVLAWSLLTVLLLGNTVYYFSLVFLRF